MDKYKSMIKVKCHNDLLSASMSGWGEAEINIYNALLARSKEKGGEFILDADDIFELAQYRQSNPELHQKLLDKLLNDLLNLKYIEVKVFEEGGRTLKKREITAMNLVQRIEFYYDEEGGAHFKVKLNEDHEYILNNLRKNYTGYELKNLVSLSGKYTKSIYQKLMQFRTTGRWITTLEDFKFIVGVPDTYTTRNITDRIIKPAVQNINAGENEIEKLRYIVERNRKKRGCPVTGYIFEFTPIKTEKYDPLKYRREKILAYGFQSTSISKEEHEIINEIATEFQVEPEKISNEDILKICEMLSSYGEVMVLHALSEAAVYDKRTLPYLLGILREWTNRGLTAEDLENGKR